MHMYLYVCIHIYVCVCLPVCVCVCIYNVDMYKSFYVYLFMTKVSGKWINQRLTMSLVVIFLSFLIELYQALLIKNEVLPLNLLRLICPLSTCFYHHV